MSPRKTYVDEDTSKKVFDRTMMRWMWTFARPYKSLVILAFICLLFAETIPFAFPHILQILIDEALPQGGFQAALPLLGIYLGLTAAHSLSIYGKNIFGQYLGLNVIHDLRTKLFSKVQRYNMRFFHKTPVGRLMTRMTNDVDVLNTMFSEGLLDLLASMMMLLFSMAIMLLKDWRLGLVTLLYFPLMVVATSIFRVKVRNINVIIRKELADLNSVLQESLNGMLIVQLFKKQKERYDSFEESNRHYRDAFFKNIKYYSYYFPVVNGLTELSIATLYFAGAWLILDGEVSIGLLVAFTWYATNFNRPLREISDRITNLQSAMSAGERILTLLETDAPSVQGDQPLRQPRQIDVEFSNVHFHYNEDTPVLKDVSFSVSAGNTLAIVGATGSGKSTIMSLLNRFYTPKKGQIRLNKQDILTLKEEDLRSAMGMVTQDVFLFSDTIRNNVLLGLPYDEERFQDAVQKACVDEIIRDLPDGYDTLLGEEGRTLSTGQRQLLSFARAIYADPKLLLLDEATSSIDAHTETLIQKATDELLKNRTAIIVAHRLSTIANANNILVLHQGEIVEEGPHEKLMQKEGIYNRLVRLQNAGSSV